MAGTETWKNVGGKIRQLRKTNQLTIRQLANGCDLSPNAISLVERGEVAPSVATLCKIAHALGVPASSLFHEVCSPEVVLSKAGEACQQATWVCDTHGAVRQSILCLSGCITFELDDQSFCLEPGDQLTFNSEAFHRWSNSGPSTGMAVVILPGENTMIRNTGD
jgi:transcriptional regulator with XRE-family HTH domain